MPDFASLTEITRPAKTAALLLAASLLGACAAAFPAAGDVAGAAVDKGGDFLKRGKVEIHQPINIHDMMAITRRAATELDLKQIGEETHPDQLKLIYTDMRKQHITITLVRRTLKVTEIRTDVGLFGDYGIGELMLRQMLADLPSTAATQRISGR